MLFHFSEPIGYSCKTWVELGLILIVGFHSLTDIMSDSSQIVGKLFEYSDFRTTWLLFSLNMLNLVFYYETDWKSFR